MKTERTLIIGGKVLRLRQRIVMEHCHRRNKTAVEFAQTQELISRHRQAIVESRLGVIERLMKVRQLLPPKSIDPVQEISLREKRVMSQLNANANIRAEVERRLRAQAAQAAVDRANFIDQVKRDLPEELWEETIDDYDRRVYESREDGSS